MSLNLNNLIPVLGAIFTATLIRSSFGFGEALIAVPLLSFFIPLEVAVPLATLVSITVAFIVVIQDRDKIHIRSASILIASTLFGIPLGLFLLTRAPENIIKFALAIFIMSFSLFCLVFRNKVQLKNDKLACFFGFGAGILGGLYGMNGPPLVMYGSFRRWSPQHFRATLQGYFLPASMVGMCGYWLAGLWVPAVTHYYFVSLPICLIAIFLGRLINRRFSGKAFASFLHIALIMMAAVLLFQSQGFIHTSKLPSTQRKASG